MVTEADGPTFHETREGCDTQMRELETRGFVWEGEMYESTHNGVNGFRYTIHLREQEDAK